MLYIFDTSLYVYKYYVELAFYSNALNDKHIEGEAYKAPQSFCCLYEHEHLHIPLNRRSSALPKIMPHGIIQEK
jgi:hypothetical protein